MMKKMLFYSIWFSCIIALLRKKKPTMKLFSQDQFNSSLSHLFDVGINKYTLQMKLNSEMRAFICFIAVIVSEGGLICGYESSLHGNWWQYIIVTVVLWKQVSQYFCSVRTHWSLQNKFAFCSLITSWARKATDKNKGFLKSVFWNAKQFQIGNPSDTSKLEATQNAIVQAFFPHGVNWRPFHTNRNLSLMLCEVRQEDKGQEHMDLCDRLLEP